MHFIKVSNGSAAALTYAAVTYRCGQLELVKIKSAPDQIKMISCTLESSMVVRIYSRTDSYIYRNNLICDKSL